MKAIIFDFDGTLANTLPVCFYAFQSVFKAFDDKDVTSEDIVKMFGPSETGIIRENLQHNSIDDAIELYYSEYTKKHSDLVENYNEMHELLHHLRNEGYKLGIVTGKAKRSLNISLEKLNMKEYFEVMITGDDVVQPKPDPEGLNEAIKLLGVDKNEVIFVGDSDADILAGKRANVLTIGVHWLPNHQTPEFSVQPDQTHETIETFKQMFKMIEIK